jgi:integrase
MSNDSGAALEGDDTRKEGTVRDRLLGMASAASKQNEGDRKWSVLGLMAEAAEEEWHLHDLRRTAATRMGELKIGRVIIAKILNHAEPGVTAIDDRHEYRDGKRRALELWAEKLTSIAGGVEVDHNVPALSTSHTP